MKKLVVCALSIGSLLTAVSAAQAGGSPPPAQQPKQQPVQQQKTVMPSKLVGNAGGTLIGQDGAGKAIKTGR